METEKVVVQYHQERQRKALNLEVHDCLEPVLKLTVEPLAAVVVIEMPLQSDLLDVDQPETDSDPERLSGYRTKWFQAIGDEYPRR